MNYSEIKNRLRVRLMPVKGNEYNLSLLPHYIYEDIAMIYWISGPEITVITNRVLDILSVSADQLHEDALEAAYNSCGISFRSIGQLFELNNDIAEDPTSFYIATAGDYQFGAWTIFYKDNLAAFAQTMDCEGYYILPSSIHEMLLLPNKNIKPGELQQMVAEINATAVAPEERLTDSVYYYDAIADTFRRVA